MTAPGSRAAATSAPEPAAASGRALRHSEFSGTAVSSETRRVADWVVGSNDNHDLPFMIIDKVGARLFLFDGSGGLRATAPVLLGLARGDDSPPGIGTRTLSSIKPAERITPAGRFVVEAGLNMDGKDIVWVDYDAAISLHRASDRKPGMAAPSRVQRLASATAAEKRVSLGCINVTTSFYDAFIQPTFARTKGIAYILPETRTAGVQFGMPNTDDRQSPGA